MTEVFNGLWAALATVCGVPVLKLLQLVCKTAFCFDKYWMQILKLSCSRTAKLVLTTRFQVDRDQTIPDVAAAGDDAGGRMTITTWYLKTCKEPVKSLPLIYQHSVLYRLDVLLVASVKALRAQGGTKRQQNCPPPLAGISHYLWNAICSQPQYCKL